MAATASPPPQSGPTASLSHVQHLDTLDEDIRNVRAEIATLITRRSILKSALLNNSAVQTHLKSHSQSQLQTQNSEPSSTTTPISISQTLQHQLNLASSHTASNIHRIAFGVTAFSFADPNPATTDDSLPDPKLLGIRYDSVARDGTYRNPHYVLCRQLAGKVKNGERLKVHKHTIPSFIPIRKYEAEYLPCDEDAEDELDGVMEDVDMPDHVETEEDNGRQDLHGFAKAIRHDLVSWNLRSDAIEAAATEFGLRTTAETYGGDNNNNNKNTSTTTVIPPVPSPTNHGVRKLNSVAIDARFARIEWSDGRVGQIRIADNGTIEKAVVFGETSNNGNQRLPRDERILAGSDGQTVSVLDLVGCLRKLDSKN